MLKEMKDAKLAESIAKASAFASIPLGLGGLFYLGMKIGDATLPVGQKMQQEIKESWDKFFLNPKFWSGDIFNSRILDSLADLFKKN
jgi:hypothetical protein